MPGRDHQARRGEREPVPAPGPGSSFAERLNYLFDNLRPSATDKDYKKKANPSGEFSNTYVAEIASTRGPATITAAYIGKLRNPAEPGNPSRNVMTTLARFFEVKPAYFLDDDVTQSIVSQFQFVKKLQEQQVENIALRAAGLSPASKDALLKMIEAARLMEGLPAEPSELP
ncbi:hypothetical protein [Streptomyces sp. NPDC004267]|uniref:hypothetical protein n=1 Tax=Streptomyces sp. NPDC004267 TaxID=3364694 RepID=UPI0036C56BE7